MTKKLVLISSLLCFWAIALKSQNDILPKIVPPSPNSSELGRYGAVPVGLFTGTVQMNIPLFELKTNNLSVPISLSYSSNGLKVDKIATWVGFDWSLAAGGVITRNAKGDPDNIRPLIAYSPDITASAQNLYNFLSTYQLSNDLENDEYSYNFNGQGGKFIFDNLGNAIPIPFARMKITKASNYSAINIVTQDGVKYIFSAVETSEFNDTQSLGIVQIPTSWYLTKIVHPNGEEINFYYKNSYYVQYYSGVSQSVSKYLSENTLPCASFGGANGIELDYAPKGSTSRSFLIHLDSIVAPNFGKVVFKSSLGRKDQIDEYKLDTIKFYNSKNDLLKSVVYNYSFPEGNNFRSFIYLTEIVGARLIEGKTVTHVDELKYRMFLDSVCILDSKYKKTEKYKFNYYNLGELPPRLSFSQDHWGFFNGKMNECFYPTGVDNIIIESTIDCYPTLRSKITGLGQTCSREPDGNYSKKGMISSVTYPTGGYSTFDYEPNSSDGKEYGGCRVLRTYSYAKQGSTPELKKYFYNQRSNLAVAHGYVYSNVGYVKEYKVHNTCGPEVDNETFVCCASNSAYQLYSTANNHIVYPFVNISNGENFENGGEEHFFKADADASGTPIGFCPPVLPLPLSNNGWKTGTKVSDEYYKKVNGNFINVKSVNYMYDEDNLTNKTQTTCLAINNSRTIPGYWVNISDYNLFVGVYDITKYTITSQWMPLTGTVTKTYDENGENPLEQIESFNYDNPEHLLITRKTTIASGDTIKTKYKYPEDYLDHTTEILDSMKRRYIVSQSIEEQVWVNNRNIISGRITEFGLFNSKKLIAPSKIYMLESNKEGTFGQDFNFTGKYSNLFPSGMNYQPKAEFEAYDSKGNILRISKSNDIKQSFIWGFNGTLPVAKVENALNNQIFYTSYEDTVNAKVDQTIGYSGKKCWNGNYTIPINKRPITGNYILSYMEKIGTGQWVYKKQTITNNIPTTITSSGKIDEVRVYPIEAQMYTYTYTPQVGVISVTDPNSITTIYEYDSSGRLLLIKDYNKDIIKKYDYHYKE